MPNTDTHKHYLLEQVAERLGGHVPNVYRTLAERPSALEGFVQIQAALREQRRLPLAEQSLIALEVSVAHACRYCQGAFEREARANGIDETSIARVTEGDLPDAPRDRDLVHATRRVMATKGHLNKAEQALLADRGIDRATLLEIITIVAAYTLATYANNLAGTRIDPEFR